MRWTNTIELFVNKFAEQGGLYSMYSLLNQINHRQLLRYLLLRENEEVVIEDVRVEYSGEIYRIVKNVYYYTFFILSSVCRSGMCQVPLKLV